MATSKLQREFSFALSTHFGEFTIRENSRPRWCTGPNFERLELDFWIEELDVAVEIQGQQHYVYTPHFHANYEDFIAQQARDEAKKQRCKDYRILLLEVSDTLSYDKALEIIRDRAIAERALQPAQKTNRKIEKRFRILLQLYREFVSTKNLSDDQYLQRVTELKKHTKEFRKLHDVKAILTIPQKQLAEFARLEQTIDEGALAIRHHRTLQNGFYPGEEIIFVRQPPTSDYYYEFKGFVVYAKTNTVIVEIETNKGKKLIGAPRNAVMSADHALFDKKTTPKQGRTEHPKIDYGGAS